MNAPLVDAMRTRAIELAGARGRRDAAQVLQLPTRRFAAFVDGGPLTALELAALKARIEQLYGTHHRSISTLPDSYT